MKKIKDNVPSELLECFCPAPFMSVQINAFGSAGVCPKSAGSFHFSQSTSLEEKWMSSEMEEIRKKFLSNQKPKECFRCWEEEKANMPSLRKHYLEQNTQSERYNFNMNYIDSKEYQKGPKTMVIQASNYCNYSCRTCHAIDSSGFNREGSFYAQEYNELNNRYRAIGDTNPNIEIDNKHFSETELKKYIDMSSNLKSIEFYGGEPTLNTTHHSYLQDLIVTGKSQEIELFYCTNGSTSPNKKLISLWKNFKNLIISFSIDCSGDGHNYVRYPGTWDKLKDNIEAYKALKNEGITAYLDASVTVSLLNVYYLDEIVNAISKVLDGRIPGLHLALNPSYYSIKNLPTQFKKQVANRLESSSHRAIFQGVIKYLCESETDISEFEKFVIWTKRKDLYRKQDFANVFPEYYLMVKEYFDLYSTPENLKKIIADGTY